MANIDEFVMMLQMSKEKALNVVKKIQENIVETHLLLGSAVNFTVSIGMTEVEYFDEDIEAVIKRADINFYKEKRTKRNYSRS